MLLPFNDELRVTGKFDPEMCLLADAHYSRQKPGTNQFLPPGRTLVLRDNLGLVLFGWLWQLPEYRDDGESGYCCSIFRNESKRLSSEIILEAEHLAVERWGPNRAFTYVDPAKVASANPGYCFKAADWQFVRALSDGKHLLEKQLSGETLCQ